MQTAPSPTRRAPQPFGDHLRHWRQHRRLSQLDLASDAAISTRHLSCVETGKAMPSREMVLRLAERLGVPLRERNAMLVAAGFAPMYRECPLDHPDLAPAREAVQAILRGHEPHPALAVDRHWNLIAANRMVAPLIQGADAALLEAPINVLRLSLHPLGLAPRIANLGQWRAHIFERLRQQVHATGDATLAELLADLQALPCADAERRAEHAKHAEWPSAIAVPLQLQTAAGQLSLISTTTVFGSPVDVTLQELALETFFPADPATAATLRNIAASLA